MASRINSKGIRELLGAAVEAIKREEPRLNALDAAIGDGDHGITMRIGFQAIKEATEALPPETFPGQIFVVGGGAFMASTGGAIGILLGRALIAAGEAIRGHAALGVAEWRFCFQAMERAVALTGKANPGDKTLLDPLHAANEALAAAPEDIGSVDLLSIAAVAAENAARETSSMRCRMGRASRLGERALGHPDPGAMSFSVIARAMADRARHLPVTAFAESQ